MEIPVKGNFKSQLDSKVFDRITQNYDKPKWPELGCIQNGLKNDNRPNETQKSVF